MELLKNDFTLSQESVNKIIETVTEGSKDSPTIVLRHAFSGKEDQGPDFSLPWLDFGARAYSPALRRWMVPDPLGEKYPAVSPYAYCAGDPVNYVDPTGMDIREIDERGNVVYHIKKT